MDVMPCNNPELGGFYLIVEHKDGGTDNWHTNDVEEEELKDLAAQFVFEWTMRHFVCCNRRFATVMIQCT